MSLAPDLHHELANALAGLVPEIHLIGDCGGVGYIEKAVKDGASAALKI